MCSNMICSLYFSTKDIQTYYFKIVIHRRYDVLFLLHSLTCIISFLEIDVLTRKQIKNKIEINILKFCTLSFTERSIQSAK